MSTQDSGATRALTISDIDTTINHEPRIRDTRLAEYLGYADVKDLRQLARRHREALERFGEVSAYRARKPGRGSQGGRPEQGEAYNKRQTLYLCAKSEKPNATELTIEMVAVFDAFMAGRLGADPAAAPIGALPPPAEPPFCRGCHARLMWENPSLPCGREWHPLAGGPITRYELTQLVLFRGAVTDATKAGVDQAVEQALEAVVSAARKATNGPGGQR